MPQVAVPHVIGTAVLIALLGVVVLYSNNLQYNIFVSNVKSKLLDISEYVVSEIESHYSIVVNNEGEQSVFKILDIPSNVYGKGYSLYLYNDSGSIEVVVSLDDNPNIRVETPVHMSGEIHIINNTNYFRIDSYDVYVVESIHSGLGVYNQLKYKGLLGRPVVVVIEFNGSVYIGLGYARGL